MKGRQRGGLAQMAQQVQRAGRSGDTRLAHINPEEARLLKSVGGAGTINPATGLPEYKFGLKKLKKTAKKVVSAPIKLATKVASSATTAPLKAISAVTGINTKGVQKIVKKPIKLVGRAAREITEMPLDIASGTVNLAANPTKQIKQIGREAGRTAQSKLLPIAAGFIPGVGPALSAGIAAAQGGYAARKGGLGSILTNAALSGGLAYAGGKATQGLLGKIPALSGTYGPGASAAIDAAKNATFDLGSGTGSILGSSGSLASSGLSQFAAPAASTFNLGTGVGSIAAGIPSLAQYAAPAASAFNLASGAGSILGASAEGLGLSQSALDAASTGANFLNPASSGFNVGDAFKAGKQVLGQATDATAKPQQSSGFGGLGGLLGAGLGGYALSELLQSGKDYNAGAPQMQMPQYQSNEPQRVNQNFDWEKMRQIAKDEGIDPSQVLARSWDKIASAGFGTPQQPVKMARGGALSNLVQGRGAGRDDVIDAKLSNGEYIMDAETVALLGDGSTDAGAKRLDGMRQNLRAHKGKMLSRGKISPNAKSPLSYLKGAK